MAASPCRLLIGGLTIKGERGLISPRRPPTMITAPAAKGHALPLSSLFDMIETRDWDAYREASERLHAYRIGDFSPLDDVVRDVYERTKGLIQCPPDITGGACRDVGVLYMHRPSRKFLNMGEPAARTLAEVYERSDVNSVLNDVDQAVHAQNVVVVAVDPAGPRRVRLVPFMPFEVGQPYFDDLLETDLRKASKVTLRVPVGVSGGSTIYGQRVYTPERAYIEGSGGEFIGGIFEPDGRNPFGFIPLAVRREEPPARKGEWFPPINEALKSLAESVALGVADCLKTCRHQAHGRRILTGTVGAEPVKLQAGAEAVWFFRAPDDGAVPVYGEYMKEPPVKAYWESMTSVLEYYERFSGLTPGALSGRTGTAKSIELESHRNRIKERIERTRIFEQQLCEVIARVAPTLTLAGAEPRVHVDFHLFRPEGNALQDEQAAAIRYASGLDSPVERVMRSEGITREEATERVTLRKSESVAFAPSNGEAVQGMDKTLRGFGDA